MALTLSPAVFIDKDGTLIHDVPYNVDPSRIQLTPRAVEGLKLLSSRGFKLVVVSNQAGIARGLFGEEALLRVEQRLRSLLFNVPAILAGFYFCPHHPDGVVQKYRSECFCRKPRPGMLIRAAAELGLDLDKSWMVGDILDDVEAGRAAGCKTVMLVNGNETEWRLSEVRTPDYFATDLAEAARFIVSGSLPTRVSPFSSFTRKGDRG